MWLLFILLAFLPWLLYHAYFKRSPRLPPGPVGVPILGFLPWLDPKAPHVTLTNLVRKYGSIYGLHLGSVYTVVLTDPKVIRSVFSKDAASGRAPLYLTHGIMKGYGLICAEGDLWKDQRKFVHKCLRIFGGTKIGPQRKKMEELILQHAEDFTNFVKNMGDNVCLNPLEPLRHSLGSAINVIVFGKCWSREDPTWKWLQHLQEEGTKHIGVAGPLNFLPFLKFLPKFQHTMKFLIEGKLKTHELYKKIIEEQEKTINDGKFDEENVANILQAFLLERKNVAGDREIFYCDQQFFHLLADIFGAGLDTTLTTLRWFMLYIAKNKQIQDRLQHEIRAILQGKSPSMDDISSMPLMEAAIAETQRIRSVVPVGIPHGLLSDLEIEGYNVPKGSMIVPLQWAIHMDEHVWQNPEEFDPSRFLNEEGTFFKHSNFMPFQTGKRMCVGDELARMLLFIFSTTVLQNFRLELEGGQSADFEGECGITLTPKDQQIVFSSLK